MCTLAIYFKMIPGYPVVVAANRDEVLARPAAPPTTILENPRAVGGKDLHAGGTWLGINEHDVIAGLLNRRLGATGDPRARSRGLLCLDVLRSSSVAGAVQFMKSQHGSDYNPFNLLVASRDESFVAYNRDGTIELATITPGLHLLTNLDVDDFECPKINSAYDRFAELGRSAEFRRDPVGMRGQLAELLADHSTQLDPRSGRPNSLCVHLDGYGTRSSSLIFVGSEHGRVDHFFAPGPPCTTSYERALLPADSFK